MADLESKWNKGKYNYQHGYCHYFAYNLIDKIKKIFPKREVKYYLLLAKEFDEDDVEVNSYLVHVYIMIDNLLLDSNGFTTKKRAMQVLEEWEERQRHLVPDEYSTEIWDEISDEIPKEFFNNEFCNTGRVKKDLDDFLNNPIVKRLFRDK